MFCLDWLDHLKSADRSIHSTIRPDVLPLSPVDHSRAIVVEIDAGPVSSEPGCESSARFGEKTRAHPARI